MAIKTSPPRDPSDMVSNSHPWYYTALAIAFVLIAGYLIFADYQKVSTVPTQTNPPVSTPQ
jgi:hypothetical protein